MMAHRIAGVAGLIYVGAIILSAITFGDAPSVEASVAEIRDYLGTNAAIHRIGGLLAALAVPFGALFFAGVVRTLRRYDSDGSSYWAEVARFGAIIVLTCVIIADLLLDVLFFRDDAAGLDDATIGLLWDGQIIAYSIMGVGVAILTGAFSIASLQHSIWPRWHAWLGLLVALIALVGPFAVLSATETGEILSAPTFPALLLWSLASAIQLLRSAGKGAISPKGPPMPERSQALA